MLLCVTLRKGKCSSYRKTSDYYGQDLHTPSPSPLGGFCTQVNNRTSEVDSMAVNFISYSTSEVACAICGHNGKLTAASGKSNQAVYICALKSD